MYGQLQNGGGARIFKMIPITGALDLWTLFINYVFGSFWLAVIGLCLLMFIILMLGRISIYTSTMYIILFVLAMALGYGIVIVNMFITLMMLVAFYFSWIKYLNSAGGS